jgi:hypothetical protein
MTIGEQRVRVTFNPSNSDDVYVIKSRSADLIDQCEKHKRNGEQARCAAKAQDLYEEAAMWAVKHGLKNAGENAVPSAIWLN